MNELITILGLIVIILIQVIERFFLVSQQAKKDERLLDELSRATKAVIAKNANDYVMTAAIDKVAAEEPVKQDNDLVSEETLSDEEFMKAINKDLQ